MKKIKLLLIGSGSRWLYGYNTWIMNNKDKIEIVGIAEKQADRRAHFQKEHGLPVNSCFETWEELLAFFKDKEIDGVAICTSDHDHYKPAMACLERGYNLLLEKPIAPTPQECVDIAQMAEKNNCIVMVAHVLRYTPFFTKIRKLIADGEIGALQSIQHTESIGYFHMAHSFVRGIWNNKKTSNPLILSKSCHDLDILLYIMGEGIKAIQVAGFGSLKHFTKENAPKGAPERCIKSCPVYNTCPYSVKTYIEAGGFARSVDPIGDLSNLEETLKTSRYGRCVYHCDNTVCDSMSSIIEYDNGVNATFTLSAFTDQISRTINIMGSHGQICGDMEKDEITVAHFGQGDGIYRHGAVTTYHPSEESDMGENIGYKGHGGGDALFLEGLVQAILGKKEALTKISESVESHLIAFALEESRVNKTVTHMDQFKKMLQK